MNSWKTPGKCFDIFRKNIDIFKCNFFEKKNADISRVFLYVCIRHTQLIRAFQLRINKIQKRKKRFATSWRYTQLGRKKNLIFGNPIERTERRYNIGFSYSIEIRKVIYNFYFHSLQHHTLFSLDHVYQIIHTSIFPVIFILHNGLTPFWITHLTTSKRESK